MLEKAKALFGLLKVEPINTRDELADVCKATAVNQLQRDTIILQKDAEQQMLNDRYDGQIEAIQRGIDENVKRIEVYCKTNRKEEFGEKQTIFVGGHELSFQKSKTAVGFIDGISAGDVVDAILALPEDNGGPHDILKASVLRVAADLDKNAVKREWKINPEAKTIMEANGVRMVDKETFKFIPSRESITVVETVDSKEAA